MGECFGQVDFEDFVGDGVVDPAFFDKGNEEGAGFFGGFEVEGVEGVGVGVGLDGGGGGEDQYLDSGSTGAGCESGLSPGFDYADDRDGQSALDVYQGRGRWRCCRR